MPGRGSAVPAPSPAGKESPAAIVEAAIKQAVPNCKTQAHFDLILNAWQAMQTYLNAAYGFDEDIERLKYLQRIAKDTAAN